MTKVLLIFLSFVIGINAQSVQLVQAGPPPVIRSTSLNVVGARGSSRYCYYVIARYPGGNAQLPPPVCTSLAPNTLDSNNYVTVNWQPSPGATGYDVLRLTTDLFPSSGSCSNCLVASNTSTTSVTNNGSVTSPYSLGQSIGLTPGVYSVDNLNYSTPRTLVNPPLDGSSIQPGTVPGANTCGSPNCLVSGNLTVQGNQTNSGTLSVGATDPTVAITTPKVKTANFRTFASLGDSITRNTCPYYARADERSWVDHFEQRSYGNWWNVNNAGVCGNTSDLMLARISTDIIGYKPDYAFIMCCTNDNLTNVNPSTSLTNVASMISALLTVGIRPIIFTPLKNTGSYQSNLLTLRNGLLAFAGSKNVVVVDTYSALATAPTTDGIHPSVSESITIADFAISALQTAGFLISADVAGLPLATTGLEPWNIAANGLFRSVASSPTPDGMSLVTGGGTASIGTARYGNYFQYTVGSGQTAYLFSVIPTTNITTGHRYSIAARVETLGSATYTMSLQWSAPNVAYSALVQNWTTTLSPDSVVHMDGTAPSGSSTMDAFLSVTGPGTIRISQVSVRDLTVNPLRLSASGSSCTVTAITEGRITGATCTP